MGPGDGVTLIWQKHSDRVTWHARNAQLDIVETRGAIVELCDRH